MNFSQLLKEKKINSNLIKEKHNLLKKNKALWLVLINDKTILNELISWCANLPVDFVINYTGNEFDETNNVVFSDLYNSTNINSWFDFVVSDYDITSLDLYLSKWIAPILPEKNHMKTLLKEFNPMKNEGNSYFYTINNSWSIFYSIIRYLENYKFTFDNKNLVKNVFDT